MQRRSFLKKAGSAGVGAAAAIAVTGDRTGRFARSPLAAGVQFPQVGRHDLRHVRAFGQARVGRHWREVPDFVAPAREIVPALQVS